MGTISIKIGDAEFTKSDRAEYVVTMYGGSSIGIRARVQSVKDTQEDEAKLYKLREGRTQEIVISSDDGTTIKGMYKINELNWKKQMKADGVYELAFNIGLQKQ